MERHVLERGVGCCLDGHDRRTHDHSSALDDDDAGRSVSSTDPRPAAQPVFAPTSIVREHEVPAGERITMTGAEHYAAAEALLDEVAANPDDASSRLAVAQVHATLALAAATAMASRLVETEDGDEIAAMDPTDQEHWDNVAG
jgi:hypothetical protein